MDALYGQALFQEERQRQQEQERRKKERQTRRHGKYETTVLGLEDIPHE
jgi:hypothetical protein